MVTNRAPEMDRRSQMNLHLKRSGHPDQPAGSIAQGFQASVYSLLTCRQHRSSPHGFERATQA